MTVATTLSLALVVLLAGCGSGPETNPDNPPRVMEWNPEDRVEKSDAEWRAQLNDEEYRVLRKHGTERAFTGDLHDNKRPGAYVCAGCGLVLFSSEHKYDSGTGWPSYFKPVEEKHVGTQTDRGLFMTRTEVHCARCGGHLGHVFEDGPAPTGLRYCINSASLDFVEKAD